MGTSCQLCGMPVQHDHYVGRGEHGLIGIYRGNGHSTHASVFPFGPEHEWLKRAVAVPAEGDEPVAAGWVEDGALQDQDGEAHLVMDGYDDYGAFHEACWRLAGEAQTCESLRALSYQHELTYLKSYQGQLFDFEALKRDERDWMLVDPYSLDGQRNRARIEGLIRTGMKEMPQANAASAAELLETNLWSYNPKPGGFWRYRINFDRDIDTLGYPVKLWVKLPVPEPRRRELWESEFVAADGVVLLAAEGAGEHLRFFSYARSSQIAERACKAPGAELSVAEDPRWETYFTEVAPRLS